MRQLQEEHIFNHPNVKRFVFILTNLNFFTTQIYGLRQRGTTLTGWQIQSNNFVLKLLK